MKKIMIMFLLVCFGIVFSQTATAPAVGDGSVGNPYQIANLENLYWIAANNTSWNDNFIQTADIDASETSTWFSGDHDGDGLTPDEPMGWKKIGNLNDYFTGSYDGQSYTISNLYINDLTDYRLGFFGYISTATIENVGLENIIFSCDDYAGGLTGKASNSTVDNCYSTGSISGGRLLGSLIGKNARVTVNNCWSSADVSSNSNSAGGLVGGLTYIDPVPIVTNSYAVGNVKGSNDVGGFAGFGGAAVIQNCYSAGKITSTGYYTGGFLGEPSSGSVTNCFWDIETSKIDSSGGGTGLTTAEMQTLSTFTDAGWDFVGESTNGTNDIWNISSTNNFGYPYLSWQIFPAEPIVKTQNVINTSTTTSDAYYQITDLGDSDIIQHGVCWNTTGDPTLLDNITEEGTSSIIGAFTSELTSLISGTEYYLRSYATNSDGTCYGNEVIFTSATYDPVTPLGTGEEGDPYQIANLGNLYWIYCNPLDWDKYFIQTADIDASTTSTWYSGAGWNPIGRSYENFTGTYDGDGYTIDNLYIDRPSENNIGLFGSVSWASIKNVSIVDVNITGYSNVGGMAGFARFFTTISNSYTVGNITSYSSGGGFIGVIYSNVEINSCYSTGDVNGISYIGGFIGWNDNSSINNSYSTCNISGGSWLSGGFIGENGGTVNNCYSSGYVTSGGGFIGLNNSSRVYSCFWDIETSGQTYSDGGTGLTTTEMQSPSTYIDSGWDFVAEITNGTEDIWNINPSNNSGYPYLNWQTFPGDSLACTLLGDIVNTTISSSTANCYITSLGSSSITQHGVCWNTTGVPTIADYKTEEGLADSIGTFNSDITGINANTRYYVRAYVTNSEETIYSNELDFYSAPVDPVLPPGSGTELDPYVISSLENLYWMTQNKDEWDKEYIQDSNINASPTISWYDGAGWTPLGNSDDTFNGNYDGQGHLIDSLFIVRPTDNNVGFFGYTRGDITKLGVSNINIEGNDNIGGLVGLATGNIYECFTTGFVYGNESVGGLVGYNGSRTYNSYSFCDTYGVVNIGGLFGVNWGSPQYSFSKGLVTGSTIGGLVAYGHNTTVDETNFWDIESSSVDYSNNAVGLSTIEMKSMNNYLTAGWDFAGETDNGTEDIWDINPQINNGYPHLSWQIFPGDTLACTLLLNISNNTVSSSTADCYLSSVGNSNIVQHGVCWNTSGDPTILDDMTEAGPISEIGAFSSDLTGLTSNTEYYVRAYVTTVEETVYSNNMNFYSAPVNPTHPGGVGTEGNPYVISSLENLYWITQNKGDWDKYYMQSTDVNASSTADWFGGAGWIPIGDDYNNFNGHYDGQGHIIDSLYINRSTEDYVGFIGKADSYSGNELYIDDLGLTNLNITGHDYVGGMCASARFTNFNNCYTTGNVTGNNKVGGFNGIAFEAVNCFSRCDVSGVDEIGGFTSYCGTWIKNCYSTGTVSGNEIGGFCGSNWGTANVQTSYWDIEASGVSTSPGGTGKTTAQMKTESTFTSAGWDFTTTWDINGVTNGGYPFLSWMSTSIDNGQFAIYNYKLEQNYPNPFNPTTTISFSIPSIQDVKLSVYNSNGQLVKTLINDELSKGHYKTLFDAKNLNSGIYFYTLQTGEKVLTNKMLLIK